MIRRSLILVCATFLMGHAAACFAAPAPTMARDSVAVPFPSPAVRRWQVGLLRPDRLQHATLSLTLGLAAGLVSRRAAVAGYGSLALGLAKELYDVHGTGFDPVDVCADAVGAGAAAYATHLLED
jgi:hypothetical protein